MQAQFELGEIYARGQRVPRNDREAFRWYRMAAEQGHGAAQYNLGLMYKDARAVGRDYVQAYKWLNLSTARGHPNAALRMDSLARLMSREQISEAQREAKAFVPKKQTAPPPKEPPESASGEQTPQTQPSAP